MELYPILNLERKDKSLKRFGNLAIKRFTNKRIIIVVYRARNAVRDIEDVTRQR